mmetsp:Transcript_30242/g.44702  ORF Transcript_30242/g.44702 Transcript_30242/m.44702 type:complete len:88 (-) Transcript_30242:95-358(-)
MVPLCFLSSQYLRNLLVYISLILMMMMVVNNNNHTTISMTSTIAPLCALLLFVTVELCMNATSQHEWYQKQFQDYPLHRRAIIPFWL